ncbi:hypothetical protein PS943_04144 [Pseudomonas fluorescens]|uniref:Uncharacterized protein n=1 Tax=Pseudomonas fluorescens TaxID=294 RepID=A0A5E7WIY8_PSEFL|nr:hypothetical protein PS943_04144 [Pseudomonas fluorescens]
MRVLKNKIAASSHSCRGTHNPVGVAEGGDLIFKR